jgi:hypothetical protein
MCGGEMIDFVGLREGGKEGKLILREIERFFLRREMGGVRQKNRKSVGMSFEIVIQ